MENKILVTYATKHGATKEIAEKIGEVLNGQGILAEVIPIKDAGDPAHYGAVIFGSAAYIGGWRKEAVNYILEYETKLAVRPVWLFTSGPTGKGDPLELLKGWQYPDKVKTAVGSIKPQDVAVFGGKIDTAGLGLLERFMISRVKAATGDFRNWDDITAWAGKIAKTIKKEL